MKKSNPFFYMSVVVSMLIVPIVRAQTPVSTDDTTVESFAPSEDEKPDEKNSDKKNPSDAQIYNIRSGDTMWDICKIVLDNPWYWPKLWAINQYILNPNLIYPGNHLAFSPGGATTFPKMEVVSGENSDTNALGPDEPTSNGSLSSTTPKTTRDSSYIVEESSLRKGESLGLKLRSIALVAKNGIKTIGEISSSIERKMNLVFGDQVYLTFKHKTDVKVGDKFQIIENVKAVYDPDRDTVKVGQLIKKKAVVTVTHIIEDKRWKKRVVEATYTDGDDPIQRGNEIIPYESNYRTVKPHFTDKQINGKIVEADAEQILISNNDFVFLNLGTKNGLETGLQLYVVRRGDGLEEFVNDSLPDHAIARILIVEAFDSTATAYVTTLDEPLLVGDRVRSTVE